IAVFLARIVIPRSRSSSFESMTRSTWCSLERNVPLCCSIASTSVVLPWSTWAMIAMLRMPELKKDPSPKYGVLLLYYEGDETPTKDAVISISCHPEDRVLCGPKDLCNPREPRCSQQNCTGPSLCSG